MLRPISTRHWVLPVLSTPHAQDSQLAFCRDATFGSSLGPVKQACFVEGFICCGSAVLVRASTHSDSLLARLEQVAWMEEAGAPAAPLLDSASAKLCKSSALRTCRFGRSPIHFIAESHPVQPGSGRHPLRLQSCCRFRKRRGVALGSSASFAKLIL